MVKPTEVLTIYMVPSISIYYTTVTTNPNIRHTLVGNKIVDDSDVVVAAPVVNNFLSYEEVDVTETLSSHIHDMIEQCFSSVEVQEEQFWVHKFSQRIWYYIRHCYDCSKR